MRIFAVIDARTTGLGDGIRPLHRVQCPMSLSKSAKFFPRHSAMVLSVTAKVNRGLNTP